MSDKRFKQIRNYFYSIKDECLSLMRFKCLLYMNVLNDDDGGLLI